MSSTSVNNSEAAANRSETDACLDAVRNQDAEAVLVPYAQYVARFEPVVPSAPADREAVRKRLHELVRIVRDNRSTARSVT
jgi:hypothetical protein